MKKYAYICWRPYQLFHALNHRINCTGMKQRQYDLFLLDLDSLKACRQKLRQSGLFSHIYFFHETEDGKKIEAARKCLAYLFPYAFLKSHTWGRTENTFRYDGIIASGWMKYFVCMAECSPKAEILFLEDGVGTYWQDLGQRQMATKFNKLFYRLTGRGKLSVRIRKIYISRPDWISNAARNIEIQKLPAICGPVQQLIKEVFQEKEYQEYQDADIVYFDRDDVEAAHRIRKFEKQEVLRLLSGTGKKLTIRAHPAQRVFPEGYPVSRDGYWELIASGIQDKAVFVSISSWAVFTPGILYGKHPDIILLYKMAVRQEADEYQAVNFLVEKVRGSYQGRIYTPKNMEELKTALKSAMEKGYQGR